MKILHIMDVKNRSCSGVATVVPLYLQYQSRYEDVALFDLNSIGTKEDNNLYKIFLYSEFNSIKSIIKFWEKPDIVVFHEIYKPKYLKLYKECLNNKIPYVIIPHGSLVSREQHRKYLKKMLGNLLLFNSYIRNATAVQYLNDREKDNSHFKVKKQIVSGNGIESLGKSVVFPKKFKFIYIGRYSIYTKGLDLLVESCYQLQEWFRENSISVELYGSSSCKEITELKNMVNSKKINDFFLVKTPVYDSDKLKKLCSSSCFIQLSRHEAQPTTILEALSVGLPCLVSFGTSFGEYINSNNCGLGIDNDLDSIMKAMKQIYADKEKLPIYSKNAVNSVKRDFDWQVITENTIEEYKKMIG